MSLRYLIRSGVSVVPSELVETRKQGCFRACQCPAEHSAERVEVAKLRAYEPAPQAASLINIPVTAQDNPRLIATRRRSGSSRQYYLSIRRNAFGLEVSPCLCLKDHILPSFFFSSHPNEVANMQCARRGCLKR